MMNKRMKVYLKRQAVFCLKEIQNHTLSDFHSVDACLLPSITLLLRAEMQCATPQQILNLPVRTAMLWIDMPGVGTMVLSHSDKD